MGLCLGEFIFAGTYNWREFSVSKSVGLDNKNSSNHYDNTLKQLKRANIISPRAYIREGGGLIFEDIWV